MMERLLTTEETLPLENSVKLFYSHYSNCSFNVGACESTHKDNHNNCWMVRKMLLRSGMDFKFVPNDYIRIDINGESLLMQLVNIPISSYPQIAMLFIMEMIWENTEGFVDGRAILRWILNR